MSVFDKTKYGHCPKCGTTNAVYVQVRLVETRPGTRTVSRSHSFCLEHAEAIWLQLVDELKTEAGNA